MPGTNGDYGEDGAPAVTYTHPVTQEVVQTFQSYKTLKKSSNYWYLKYSENNHTCLVSNCIFMGDIDNLTFDWLPIVESFPQFKFRFYRTFKGYRFFVVSDTVSLGLSNKIIHKLFKDFNCDQLYVDQVWYNSEFAARLTRKSDREELIICELLYMNYLWDEIPGHIQDAIKVHDSFVI